MAKKTKRPTIPPDIQQQVDDFFKQPIEKQRADLIGIALDMRNLAEKLEAISHTPKKG